MWIMLPYHETGNVMIGCPLGMLKLPLNPLKLLGTIL